MSETTLTKPCRTADFLGGRKLEEGIGLCLSGGGFRAMLFHLGAFVRMNEMGLLPRLARVSSVSGGSIAAGALAVAWGELQFDERGVATDLTEKVGVPILRLAQWRLDLPAVFLGMLPFVSAANVAAEVYDRLLFRRATLQELPETPRFVFNATSFQTGSLWRFSREYAAEYRVGHWPAPDLRLAVAVGASAAFPPFLSPVSVRVRPDVIQPFEGADLSCAPFTRKLLLTDGGVYDNLGLEPIWKRYRTILVSDGGLTTPAKRRPRTNWLSQAMRASDIALQQGINMRTRVLRGLDDSGEREIVHWAVGRPIDQYSVGNPLAFGPEATAKAAQVPTRLTRFSSDVQNLVMQAGYAQADAALRASGLPGLIHAEPSFKALPLLDRRASINPLRTKWAAGGRKSARPV